MSNGKNPVRLGSSFEVRRSSFKGGFPKGPRLFSFSDSQRSAPEHAIAGIVAPGEQRVRRPKAFAIAAALCLLALTPAAQPASVTPTKTEIAPGIFLFSRPGYGDVGLDANS